MKRDDLVQRGLIVLCTLLYIAVFNLTYYKIIVSVPGYAEWGFVANAIPWYFVAISWLAATIPSFWMPSKIFRPSQIFYLIQYYIIFIPACFIVYNSSRPYIAPENALVLVLLMFFGLSIIQLIYSIPLASIRYMQVNYYLFWIALFIGMSSCLFYTVFSFGSNFRLANLEDIYSVRSALAEAIKSSGTSFGGYSQMWLAGFFLPFYAAVGFETKRKWLLVLVAGGYLLLFGIGGSKTTLFSFIYFPAIFVWLTYAKKNTIPLFISGLATLLLFGPFFYFVGLGYLAHWYVAVVNVRMFSIPAQLIAQFYDFFSHQSLTYMSHVRVIGVFLSYPYDTDIPHLVGMHYYDRIIGANAGFWAADGLAAFGPPGIIIISIVCAVIFWVFDSIANRLHPHFVIISTTFIATSFGNISLFTMFLSGGFGLLLLALYAVPNKGTLSKAFVTENMTWSNGGQK